MGRWTQYDEDAYRLPAGMRRTGYDADTGCYYFSDRSGNSYTGQPGSQYGPMVAGNNPAPTSLRPWDSQSPSEPEPSSPEKSKRRATLSNVPSAFRSLRHTLTTARGPWRRDQSSGSDDEEPVLVSRPSSPLASAESTTVTPSGPSKSARTASTARKPESLTLSSSPPAPPPKIALQNWFRNLLRGGCQRSLPSSLWDILAPHPPQLPGAHLSQPATVGALPQSTFLPCASPSRSTSCAPPTPRPKTLPPDPRRKPRSFR
ncbi:hypothetical protein B0H19DRAFT_246752 [Mycena capillaripes]|nr:hypothetical protein B0H19DRAFT_246752 [Mycena capillaripes]